MANPLKLCARVGLRHLWLIDPLARALDLYALQSERCVGVDTCFDKVAAELIADVELNLTGWRPPLGEARATT